MTNQEVFDKVLNHIRDQGRPAIYRDDYKTACLYRTRDGLKCAIGCLIPDEKYQEDLEGKSPRILMVRQASGLTEDQSNLACDLQDAHDRAARHGEDFLRKFEDEMRKLAAKYGLSKL